MLQVSKWNKGQQVSKWNKQANSEQLLTGFYEGAGQQAASITGPGFRKGFRWDVRRLA